MSYYSKLDVDNKEIYKANARLYYYQNRDFKRMCAKVNYEFNKKSIKAYNKEYYRRRKNSVNSEIINIPSQDVEYIVTLKKGKPLYTNFNPKRFNIKIPYLINVRKIGNNIVYSSNI